MTSFSQLLQKIENYIEYFEKKDVNISSKSVGWHLDHSLKVIIKVCDALKASEPKEYKQNFNLARFLIFSIGMIPRGKGKAPRPVLPPENIEKTSLIKQLEEASKQLNDIESLSKNHNFKHIIFGMLNLSKTQKFLKIHTKHHLKIIEDICEN